MDDLSTSEYIGYAWENLWFMRPEWLYAFIPIALIVVLFLLTYNTKAAWKKSFNPSLLPFLTITNLLHLNNMVQRYIHFQCLPRSYMILS